MFTYTVYVVTKHCKSRYITGNRSRSEKKIVTLPKTYPISNSGEIVGIINFTVVPRFE